MLNILVICKRFYTSHDLLLDRFGRLYHFPHRWADRGHKVTVMAIDYRRSPSESIFEDKLNMHSHSIFSLRSNFFYALKQHLNQQKPDVVIASCDSHIGYLAAGIAEKLSVPFVYDLYHNYEDFGTNRIPGMKWMYKQALKRADLVVCDSEPLMHLVAGRCKQTHVAQQATDKSIFRPMAKEECRIELGLSTSEILLVYIGSINHRFDRDAVLHALDGLTKVGIDARLVIAGPNLDPVTARHPRIRYLGKLSQMEVPKVIASADLCLIPYTSTALAETCNPCKLSEYIACERPIVSSAVSNLAEYLPKSGHLSYPPGDEKRLMQSILEQIRNPTLENPDTALTWDVVGDEYLMEIDRIKSTTPSRKVAS